MDPTHAVEVADSQSRKRAIVLAVAAAAFLTVQLVGRPFFVRAPVAEPKLAIVMWTLTVAALLAVLATGGGLFNRRQLRALIDDDVSRTHRRAAIVTGYWVAMVTGMGLFVLGGVHAFTGREAIYLIVSTSLPIALLVFSYLELRAHRNA